jgi:hypothetical protein
LEEGKGRAWGWALDSASGLERAQVESLCLGQVLALGRRLGWDPRLRLGPGLYLLEGLARLLGPVLDPQPDQG